MPEPPQTSLAGLAEEEPRRWRPVRFIHAVQPPGRIVREKDPNVQFKEIAVRLRHAEVPPLNERMPPTWRLSRYSCTGFSRASRPTHFTSRSLSNAFRSSR